MSSYVLIELDTTPPQITWGSPIFIGHQMEVPYTVDEPEILAAELFIPSAGLTIPVTIEPDKFVITLPQMQSVASGILRAYTIDDVLNEGVPTFEVPLWSGGLLDIVLELNADPVMMMDIDADPTIEIKPTEDVVVSTEIEADPDIEIELEEDTE